MKFSKAKPLESLEVPELLKRKREVRIIITRDDEAEFTVVHNLKFTS